MRVFPDNVTARIRQWLRHQAAEINQRGVIKDVVTEGELSAGYLFILTLANLIALCGLLVNSSPVIIGAMLISPLMGPFLSIGFAFVTGDNGIWNKSVRKITLSVALTILVAALATYVSPLKEPTAEILSRTRPNLYDLAIAFFAGLAGAGALCTKKNYLTVVPGVAVATAVIPPLSVAGYGVGTWNPGVFVGGFLLFFTNFVAIILSTCIVFFFYGFRRSMASEVELSQIKKRLAFLLAVLCIISLPLVYTLHRSISEVRLRDSVRATLHDLLEKSGESHLATFGYRNGDAGILRIDAVINTVHYLKEAEVKKAEDSLATRLHRQVVLNLEQIMVQAGGLKELPQPPPPAIAPAKATEEPVAPGQRVAAALEKAKERIARLILPARITDFSVALGGYSTASLAFRMKMTRDTPLTADETVWLQRLLAADLGRKVALTVETNPFVPFLTFKSEETVLSEQMKQSLLTLREVYASDPDVTIRIVAFPVRNSGKERRLAAARLKAVVDFVTTECRVPSGKVTADIGPRQGKEAGVRVTVLTGGHGSSRTAPPAGMIPAMNRSKGSRSSCAACFQESPPC